MQTSNQSRGTTDVDCLRWEKTATTTLIFIVGASGVITFIGFYNAKVTSLTQRLFLPLLCTSVSVILGAVWWPFFFSNYPKASKKRRRLLVAGIAVLCAVLISTSTVFGITGMAGDRCRVNHLVETLRRKNETYGKLVRSLRAQHQIIPDLEAQAAAFRRAAVAERYDGATSGKRSSRGIKGPVTAALEDIAHRFSEAATMLKGSKRKSEQTLSEALILLGSLRKIVNGDLSLDEKEQRAERKLARLDLAFSSLSSSPLVTLKGLLGGITQTTTAGAGAAGETTTASIVKVRRAAGNASSLILRRMALIETDDIIIRPFRILDRLDAVRAYPGYAWPQIMYGLTIDCIFPLGTLLLLTWLRDGRKPPAAVAMSEQSSREEVHDVSPDDRLKSIASIVRDRHRARNGQGNSRRAD